MAGRRWGHATRSYMQRWRADMQLQSLSYTIHTQEQSFRITRPPAALLMAKTPTSGAGAVSCSTAMVTLQGAPLAAFCKGFCLPLASHT